MANDTPDHPPNARPDAPAASDVDDQVITITLREYRALKEDQAELGRLRGVAGGPLCLTKVRFRHDAELVRFLNEHATSATLDWLVAEAQRRFGPDRAPSRTSVWRYVQAVRNYLSMTNQTGGREPS